jgi:hypothetical protein
MKNVNYSIRRELYYGVLERLWSKVTTECDAEVRSKIYFKGRHLIDQDFQYERLL